MKIILSGIEYVGTTTIANLLKEWKIKTTGTPFYDNNLHDHMISRKLHYFVESIQNKEPQ